MKVEFIFSSGSTSPRPFFTIIIKQLKFGFCTNISLEWCIRHHGTHCPKTHCGEGNPRTLDWVGLGPNLESPNCFHPSIASHLPSRCQLLPAKSSWLNPIDLWGIHIYSIWEIVGNILWMSFTHCKVQITVFSGQTYIGKGQIPGSLV